jgi:hypothetical protein
MKRPLGFVLKTIVIFNPRNMIFNIDQPVIELSVVFI